MADGRKDRDRWHRRHRDLARALTLTLQLCTSCCCAAGFLLEEAACCVAAMVWVAEAAACLVACWQGEAQVSTGSRAAYLEASLPCIRAQLPLSFFSRASTCNNGASPAPLMPGIPKQHSAHKGREGSSGEISVGCSMDSVHEEDFIPPES